MLIENRNPAEFHGRDVSAWQFSETIVCKSGSEHLSSGRSLFFSRLLSEPLHPQRVVVLDQPIARRGRPRVVVEPIGCPRRLLVHVCGAHFQPASFGALLEAFPSSSQRAG